MNLLKFPFFGGVAASVFCAGVVLTATVLRAQQPTAHARPAARPTAAPAAPAPTPPPLAAPVENVPGDTTPPTDDVPDKGPETETDIDASQSASFNSKDRIAVFTGNVRVKDPRFELACDELTVYLNKGAAPGATPEPNATPASQKPATLPAPGAEPSPAPSGGGIDHAVAKGHVIIIQRKAATKEGEEDKISIGRGGLGTFDNKSGDMVLKDWPNLEQNGSSLVATAQGTVMTIHRDSSMNTEGPSKTKLIQHGKGGTLDIPMAPSAPSTGGNRRGNQPPAPAASPAVRGSTAAGTQH